MSYLDYLKDRTSRYKINKLFEYMRELEEGCNGNIELSVEPETLDTEVDEANDDFEREVTISLEDGEGNLHQWFNGEVDVDIADDSTDGEAQFEDGTTDTQQLKLERGGEATITIVYDTSSGDFEAGDEITVTVSSDNILGYSIDDATSIDTLAAE